MSQNSDSLEGAFGEFKEALETIRNLHRNSTTRLSERQIIIGAVGELVRFLRRRPEIVRGRLALPFIRLLQGLGDLEDGKVPLFLQALREEGDTPPQHQTSERVLRAALAAAMEVAMTICDTEENAAILVVSATEKRDSAILASASAETIKEWRKKFRRPKGDKRGASVEDRKYYDDFLEFLKSGDPNGPTQISLSNSLRDLLDDLAPRRTLSA